MSEKEKKQLIEILQRFHDICEDLSYGRTVASQLAFANVEIEDLKLMFLGINSD